MNWVLYLLALAFSGFVVGGLARLLTPGKEAMGVFGTILAGLAGSFVGGLIAYYLFGSTSFWLNLLLAVGAAVLFILPFKMYYAAPTTVVEAAPVRRGFWGSRTVDADYAYGRPTFWGRRRRGLF